MKLTDKEKDLIKEKRRQDTDAEVESEWVAQYDRCYGDGDD